MFCEKNLTGGGGTKQSLAASAPAVDVFPTGHVAHVARLATLYVPAWQYEQLVLVGVSRLPAGQEMQLV